MSAKPLLALLCLTTFSLGVPQGCGGDEEADAAAKGKKKGKKGAAAGAKAKSADDGSSVHEYEVVEAADEVVVVHLGEIPVVTDPGSVNEAACETYIQCACDLEAYRSETPSLGHCEHLRTVFEDASERDGTCAERLEAELRVLPDDFVLPESCQ